METTGGYASWININNEQHNRCINNMVGAGILEHNQHKKNGVVQQKYQMKYIYSKYTVNYITPNLILNGMKNTQNL